MLESLKAKIVEIAIKAEHYGLCKEKAGNFSIRDKETGYVLITPSGIGRGELKTEYICVLDLDGNVIEVKKGIKPSSEILMHIEIYKTRENVNAISHTHSIYATSFSVAKKPIIPIVYESVNYGGYVDIAPYARPGTLKLAKNVSKLLLYTDACLLERHGLTTVGNDLEEALLKSRYVEEVAEIYYRSLVLNQFKEPEAVDVDEFKSWKYPEEIKF
ncbi:MULTISPECIES: class II aldolase/adducin family protein [unclassified Clostridioides]|uniref:class II aldolase/adducin family protein n=1 Tax=unclassified Clostridioides TaxID=2635829 RepID=UPI0007BB0433|nr:class II aldolase/adducin family protein [Clostridioides sp. ZZV14-6387]MCI9974756.1 class II aldolase/adducin family protein [Clostridioides difficile]MDB3083391.1 class II aldolase family protein [Clostridioides difficile]NJI80710.1 class II aldolase/adducin family protein [Clostridioides difficile]CZR97787.1 L-fuculose phosphate aldolase [Clostridioides difficile]